MASRSLSDLHCDIINKILHFIPSIWQLFQLELTSSTFRSLILDHMKLMTVVDIRTPFRISKQTEEEMKKLVSERFGSQLRKLICEPQLFYNGINCLMKAHPQLFPVNIVRMRNPDALPEEYLNCENDKQPYEVLSQFRELFEGNLSSVRRSLVVGCPELVDLREGNSNQVDCPQLVLEDEDKSLIYDDMSPIGVIREMFTRTSSTGESTLAGLKRIVIEVGQFGRELDLDMAKRLKRLILAARVEIFLELCGHVVLKEPVGDILTVIGPHISSSHFPLMGFLDSTYLLSLCNLRKLDINYLTARDHFYDDIPAAVGIISFAHIPSTVTDLKVASLATKFVDSMSDYLKTNGERLERLSIGFAYGMEQHDIAHVLEAIADNCVNLSTFHLDDSMYTSANPVDKVSQLLDKIGSKLTDLKLQCYASDIGLVETVALRCEKLKYLDLVVSKEAELDIMTSCEVLKSMPKLESAHIQLGVGYKSRITVHYRNGKLVCYPKNATFRPDVQDLDLCMFE